MTDEQLVGYLDAHQERIAEEARTHFEDTVEAVRMGMVFAQDGDQYTRWRSKRQPSSGQDLAQLARDFGGQVGHGEFEFRN